MMYRDELAAAIARADALQHQLEELSSQNGIGHVRLEALQRELLAARQEIARLRSAIPMYAEDVYLRPASSSPLILGILSLVVCILLGPFAWHLGNQELEKMRLGLVDPAGRSSVQTGRLLGMISTLLFCLVIVIMIAAIATTGSL